MWKFNVRIEIKYDRSKTEGTHLLNMIIWMPRCNAQWSACIMSMHKNEIRLSFSSLPFTLFLYYLLIFRTTQYHCNWWPFLLHFSYILFLFSRPLSITVIDGVGTYREVREEISMIIIWSLEGFTYIYRRE